MVNKIGNKKKSKDKALKVTGPSNSQILSMLTGLGQNDFKLNTNSKVETRRSTNKSPAMKFESDKMNNFKVSKLITTSKNNTTKMDSARNKGYLVNNMEVVPKQKAKGKKEETKLNKSKEIGNKETKPKVVIPQKVNF